MAINHAFYTVHYADSQVNSLIRSALLIRTSFAKKFHWFPDKIIANTLNVWSLLEAMEMKRQSKPHAYCGHEPYHNGFKVLWILISIIIQYVS